MRAIASRAPSGRARATGLECRLDLVEKDPHHRFDETNIIMQKMAQALREREHPRALR